MTKTLVGTPDPEEPNAQQPVYWLTSTTTSTTLSAPSIVTTLSGAVPAYNIRIWGTV